jgi:hypothetical protein
MAVTSDIFLLKMELSTMTTKHMLAAAFAALVLTSSTVTAANAGTVTYWGPHGAAVVHTPAPWCCYGHGTPGAAVAGLAVGTAIGAAAASAHPVYPTPYPYPGASPYVVAPAYVVPRPVIYAPAPVVVAPPPVIYAYPPGYYRW